MLHVIKFVIAVIAFFVMQIVILPVALHTHYKYKKWMRMHGGENVVYAGFLQFWLLYTFCEFAQLVRGAVPVGNINEIDELDMSILAFVVIQRQKAKDVDITKEK